MNKERPWNYIHMLFPRQLVVGDSFKNLPEFLDSDPVDKSIAGLDFIKFLMKLSTLIQ